MSDINGQRAVVLGSTGGVGRSITATLLEAGASVLGIARDRDKLHALKEAFPEMDVIAADVTHEDTVESIVSDNDIDILVLALGATPHMAPVQAQTWTTFSRPWDVDMKASFLFCKAALNKPLKPGSSVILISGGPGLGTSPLSGGLSPAKNGQLFLAEVCQGQSDKHNLGIRFAAVAPKRVMPTTALGAVAAKGYANYLGISVEAFMEKQTHAQSASDVGPAVHSLLVDATYRDSTKYVLTSDGLSPVL
ncbi:MAG: SDR family oxidoreductase [Cyanobacteria bacterium P01_D01_bin.44]